MFRIQKKKAPFFHLAAAVLATVTVCLVSDLYLWKTVTRNLFVDEILLLLIVGGLMFTLHLCAMPFFDEEYDKVSYVMMIFEGILVFMTAGIMLIIDAMRNLREIGRMNYGQTVHFDGYKHVLSAGGVGIATSVIFLIELLVYFIKPESLE